MLGIAGAYLLRAVAESTSLPRFMIAAIAIVYALSWLVASVRVPIEAWFASTVYAGTSALILAPMLWELTLRFNVMPAPAAAAILCIFVIAATALAWKRDRAPVFWVANIAAAFSALALIDRHARAGALHRGSALVGSHLRGCGLAQPSDGSPAAGGRGRRSGRMGADLHLFKPAKRPHGLPRHRHRRPALARLYLVPDLSA